MVVLSLFLLFLFSVVVILLLLFVAVGSLVSVGGVLSIVSLCSHFVFLFLHGWVFLPSLVFNYYL